MMKVGEVSLLTENVPRLAAFYRALLHVPGECDDAVHQFILTQETMLTVYNDGVPRPRGSSRLCLSFTVEDVDAERERLVSLGAQIVDEPRTRPWGARNMSALDPDGNIFFLRSLPREG